MRFPKNIGCTGVSIEKKKIVYFNEGEHMSTYAAEIDNCHNLSKVESLIVSPIFDKKGELKGVI